MSDDDIDPRSTRLIDEYVKLASSHKQAIRAALDSANEMLDLAAQKNDPSREGVSKVAIRLIDEMKKIWNEGLGKLVERDDA